MAEESGLISHVRRPLFVVARVDTAPGLISIVLYSIPHFCAFVKLNLTFFDFNVFVKGLVTGKMCVKRPRDS